MPKHHNPQPQPLEWIKGIIGLAAFLAIALIVALKLTHPAKPGPKLIEADGATYFACGGALWLSNDGDSKDPDSISYRVLFKDAQGQTHELKRVRMLKVSDLRADSPPCSPVR